MKMGEKFPTTLIVNKQSSLERKIKSRLNQKQEPQTLEAIFRKVLRSNVDIQITNRLNVDKMN
jgi:hypothetical protein